MSRGIKMEVIIAIFDSISINEQTNHVFLESNGMQSSPSKVEKNILYVCCDTIR